MRAFPRWQVIRIIPILLCVAALWALVAGWLSAAAVAADRSSTDYHSRDHGSPERHGANPRTADRRSLVRVKLDGRELEATPLWTSSSQVLLLGRDGALWEIDPRAAQSFTKTSQPYQIYTRTAMIAYLGREFGDAFEVTSEGKFLVVHPRGQGRDWARRFDELYRSFRQYFGVRGFSLQEPEFPLVAVVLRTKAEFDAYRRRDGVQTNVLGYYSPRSNRVVLYDVTGGERGGWERNVATIIHEATHQTAFNTGLHSRFRPMPCWLAEGLGTMFEAPGVWDAKTYPRQTDRLHPRRLADFRAWLKSRPADALPQMISSDRMFQTDPQAAYAQAWALTFFLVETRPREYARYVKLTCGEDFQEYPSAQRLEDFCNVFGKNLHLLDSQFLQFVEKLPR